MEETFQNSEDLLKDALINKILLASAIAAVIAVASAQARTFTIGWTFRDIV
jgi:hypothetical protein